MERVTRREVGRNPKGGTLSEELERLEGASNVISLDDESNGERPSNSLPQEISHSTAGSPDLSSFSFSLLDHALSSLYFSLLFLSLPVSEPLFLSGSHATFSKSGQGYHV